VFDPDERVFTLADVKRLFLRQKKTVFRAALLGGGLFFAWFLVASVPKYQVEATFKEGAGKGQAESGDSMKLVGSITGSGSGGESQAVVLMQSFPVLKPLVERMGLQASVPRKGRLSKLYRRVKENLLAERGKPLDDPDWFAFKEVEYAGAQAIFYDLEFGSRGDFSVFSGKKKLAKGTVGIPVSLPEVRFTVDKVPSNLRVGARYPLAFQPWWISARSLRANLRIASTKTQKSIFEVQFSHRDRFFGVEAINGLIDEYRNYLKKDHDQLVQGQLSYLRTKQDEICEDMSSVFDEYTGHLQKNLRRNGQIGLKGEIESLTSEHQALSKKLFSLDLEWEGLCQMETSNVAAIPILEGPAFQVVQELLRSISDLKQQRDAIELNLPKESRLAGETGCEPRMEELRAIRTRIERVKDALARLENSSPEESLFEPETMLESWVYSLNFSKDEERGDLAAYLENYARHLSMQEKIVQEQIFFGGDIPSEFKGIDLPTARELFLEYNSKLDVSNAAKSNYERLVVEMADPDFEIGSLSAVLADPLSQRLIERAGEIALKQKDEKHRTEKEKGRWAEELVLQKNILRDHLGQLIKVETMKSELIREKIAGLQVLSLGCISGQISVLQERLSDWVKERKNSVTAAKKIVLEKLEAIRTGFSDLPEKWRKEKWLNLKTQMGIKMVQALTELSESKTISSHLHHIETKPLDSPIAPEIPCKPGIFLKTFIGAVLFGFSSFARAFLKAVLAGFPSSREKLAAMRYPVRGGISPFCDGPLDSPPSGPDLETLRQVSLFLDGSPKGQIVGIIVGKGPDYSHALADHLSRMSIRPLLFRCDFQAAKFHPKDLPGFLQMWTHETQELPIRKKKNYDWIPSGGYTPYGTEILRSADFRQILERLKKEYDAVLLVIRAPLDSSESIAPLPFCDKAVVTVQGEPTEQLTPFIDWAYHEGMCRLALLTAGSP